MEWEPPHCPSAMLLWRVFKYNQQNLIYQTLWANQCVPVSRHAKQADNLLCNCVFHCVTMLSTGLQKWFWRFNINVLVKRCLRLLLSQRISLGVSKAVFWLAGYSLLMTMCIKIVWFSGHRMICKLWKTSLCFSAKHSHVPWELPDKGGKPQFHFYGVTMQYFLCIFEYFLVPQLKVAQRS